MKTGKKFKRVMSIILAVVMLFGMVPASTVTVSAAAASKVSLSSLGKKGSVTFGDKSKTGTWWKMKVDGKVGFCMTLGATCHSGNTYEASETHKWDQDTGGEKNGYYAKIIRWYVIKKARSEKAFVMSQALLWSIAEERNSKSQLKDVIGQVQDNIKISTDLTVDQLYTQIFEPEGLWTAEVTVWKKTGNSNGYQTLMTVDADEDKLDYEPLTVSESTYYRQRITVQKKDDDGNGLEGIPFTLKADNLDDLYSFSVSDRDGTETGDADDDDDTSFSLTGYTKKNGTIAYRMTYKLSSKDYWYYKDSDLEKMSATEKLEAKKYLQEKKELDEGEDFASDMTKASAEKMAQKELKGEFDEISNTYKLSEDNTGGSKDIILDPDFAKGVKITLKKADSWERNADKTWADTLSGNGAEFSKAYITGVTNHYKKATIRVVKTDKYSKDKKPHGNAKLDGAEFQLYADSACKTKATVYNSKGGTKTAGTYTVSGGKLTTDYLRSGATYYLKETKAPTGYTLATGVMDIKVDASAKTVEYTSDLATKEFGNNPVLGKVAIQKYYSDEGEVVGSEQGATFQVYLTSKGSYGKCSDYERDTIKTDEKGYAATKDLYYGRYTVHQVDSGNVDAYLVEDFTVDVTEDGKTYDYALKNQEFKAYLRILKKDGNTEKQVLKSNTAYQIYEVTDKGEVLVEQEYDVDGKTQKVSQFVSDDTGEVMTVKPLKSATYRIYETDSASGLHITEKYIEVTIHSKAKNYSEFKDRDGNTHLVVTTTYTNRETYGKLKLYKTGEMLAGFADGRFLYESRFLKGAVFEVYAAEDIATQDNQGTNWYDKGDLVATVTTGVGAVFSKECRDITGFAVDGDGTVAVNLPLGKYHVQEKQTIYGYFLPDSGWEVEFSWKNMDEEFVLDATGTTDGNGVLHVENERAKAALKLYKGDRANGQPIEGAEFGVFTKDNIYNVDGKKIVDAGTMLTTMKTGENGTAFSDIDLPLMAEAYSTAKTGSASADASEAGQEAGVGMTQVKTPGEGGDGKTGAGADSGQAGTTVESGDSKTGTPADGGMLIAPAVVLNSGNYYLKELSVSDSYYLDETEYPFHLEYQDDRTAVVEAGIEAWNRQTETVISKLSITDNKELAGCDLQILDSEGRVVVSWTSGDKDSIKLNDKLDELGYGKVAAELDASGNLLFKGLFHDTTYTLVELRPADGYVTADSISFQLTEGEDGNTLVAVVDGEDRELQEDNIVRMVDDTTKVEFSKTDLAGSGEVAGCELEITDKKTKEVVDAWISTKEAHRIEQKLVAGKVYVLSEKRPADGYVTADSIEFMVTDTGEVQGVEMKDDTTKIRLIKLADDTGEGLRGARFDVLDSKGKKVMSFTSVEDGVDITGKLIVGETYTFKEVEAPKGYKLAKPVSYKIKDTGEVQKISVTDKKNKKPHHPQTGGTAPILPLLLVLLVLSGGAVLFFRRKEGDE